ncbi:MAG: GNAT family N-acetyltransferase, partial [Candidatus Methanomethylicia archaeon]
RQINSKTTIVRELHVYGPQVPVGVKSTIEWQHKGLGAMLLSEAERISMEEFDAKKILVLSGIGVRSYYRRLGYRKLKDSPYMCKPL